MTKEEIKALFLNNFESFKSRFIDEEIDITCLVAEEQDRFRCLQILANHEPMMYAAIGMVARDVFGLSDQDINEAIQNAECLDRFNDSQKYFVDFCKGSNCLVSKEEHDEAISEISILESKLQKYIFLEAKRLEQERKNQGLFTANGVTFKMIAVQGGTYTMGAADNDPEAYDCEKPAHKETVSDFMIGETPVTQELWQAVMCANPSYFEGDMQRPVDSVSWDDCQTFIRKLNQLTGQNFRLPSEAEWEYAARGGNRSKGYKYAGSNDVDAVAWYNGNSGSTTHKVKTKQPNELGIYDMSGNVYEWCEDKYSENYNSQRNWGYRVLRGGSWFSLARFVRVSYRISLTPGDGSSYGGLRLAL